MRYEVNAGPIALDATTMAQTGEIIELDEADGKALVQYQILKPAPEAPPAEPAETAAAKKKRLADEEAAAAAIKAATAPAAEAAKTTPAPAA